MDYAMKTATESSPTLNERLNRSLESLQFQCERIDAVLARINSAPQKLESPKGTATPIRPTLGLAVTVEHIEQVQQRLAELAGGVERIA